jgi:streptogramin lyase
VWFTDGAGHAIGRITPSGQITEFAVTTFAGANPVDIAVGADGNLWFSDQGTTEAIGRITPSGQITETAAGTGGLNAGAAPDEIVPGPNGTLWFLDVSGTKPAIGRITASGQIGEFSMGIDPGAMLNDLTAGPDGDMWFTDRQSGHPGIGRVSPAGSITEFSVANSMSMPNQITAGPDGNVWFSDNGAPAAIGRVKPDGTIDEFSTGLQMGADPDGGITAGPDGNVWFTDEYAPHREVGRITPSGSIQEFDDHGTGLNLQNDLVLGIDGNLWMPESTDGAVGVAVPSSGAVTEFPTTDPNADLEAMTVGPDGNLWFTDRQTGKPMIGKVAMDLAPAATTGAASAVTITTATVAGQVNPLGAQTTATVQYGTSPALGSSAPAGTLAAAGTPSPVSAALSGLPSGSVVYYRVVATNAFGSATGAVKTLTTAAPPPPISPPPSHPATLSTTSRLANQQITLVTPAPSACTAAAGALKASLSSVAIAGSKAAKLRFSSATLLIDRGVRHVHKRTTRSAAGRKRTVTVVSFGPNAVVRRLPATVALRLTGLRSGTHTLKVTLAYTETVTRRHRRRTVTVSRTLRATFTVC